MKAYDVFLDGKNIETVFWNDNSDADEVKRSLINHDGYDSGIEVKEDKRRNGKRKKRDSSNTNDEGKVTPL